MSIQSIAAKRDCELLLSANQQLEQLYYQQHRPCIALHISRNYALMEEKTINSSQQIKWKEKAKLWWGLYASKKLSKSASLFPIDFLLTI